MKVRIVAVALFLLPLLMSSPAIAVEPGDDAFIRTWQRTDLPVEQGQAVRTWVWGPAGFTFAVNEPYAEAPNGERLVQYFDKSRMEINDPAADQDSPWFVTNGLLVVEMMTGHVQLGDSTFDAHEPALINVAGDANDPSGVTYATLADLRDPAEQKRDATITAHLDSAGQVSDDPSLAAYGLTITGYDNVTGHNIAGPFWDFMTSAGTVYQDGAFIQDELFLDPNFATGRPITEPYWVDARVGSEQKHVLLQCFERRCLTYTPDNPPEWRVEAGNVGRHYHTWRYGPPNGKIAFGYDGDIWIIDGNGSNPQRIGEGINPIWSPDGSSLLYLRLLFDAVEPPSLSVPTELRLVEMESLNDRFFADSGAAHGAALRVLPSYSWSPDGSRVAYTTDRDGGGYFLHVKTIDGTSDRTLTSTCSNSPLSWSPDGSSILCASGEAIYRVNVETAAVDVIGGDGFRPTYSPDGSRIAFLDRHEGLDPFDLYVMNADGTGIERLTTDAKGYNFISWSPDGSKLLMDSTARLGAELFEDPPGIFVYDFSTASLQELAPSNEFDNSLPAWSPDGEMITFVSNRSGQGFALYVMQADGTGVRQISASPTIWGPNWASR